MHAFDSHRVTIVRDRLTGHTGPETLTRGLLRNLHFAPVNKLDLSKPTSEFATGSPKVHLQTLKSVLGIPTIKFVD